jgi:hypothetical protein
MSYWDKVAKSIKAKLEELTQVITRGDTKEGQTRAEEKLKETVLRAHNWEIEEDTLIANYSLAAITIVTSGLVLGMMFKYS